MIFASFDTPTWPLQEHKSGGMKWFEGYLIQCVLYEFDKNKHNTQLKLQEKKKTNTKYLCELKKFILNF